jgi:hypothetical protein
MDVDVGLNFVFVSILCSRLTDDRSVQCIFSICTLACECSLSVPGNGI